MSTRINTNERTFQMLQVMMQKVEVRLEMFVER